MNTGLTMKISLLKHFSSIFFILFLSASVFADVWDELQGDEYKGNDVEEYVWKEGGSKTGAYPKDKNLVEISGPPAYRNYQYLIDAENLTIGADGVVRYALVIRSSSGVDNARYEGIRCIGQQIKTYAYGTTDMQGKKKFVARADPKWQPITSTGATGYGAILITDYFCDFDSINLKRNQVIQNIKYGKGEVDGIYY